MKLISLIVYGKLIRNSYKDNVEQINIALPFIRLKHLVLGKMDMTHTVALHVHTYPNAVNLLNIVVIGINKISFLLR